MANLDPEPNPYGEAWQEYRRIWRRSVLRAAGLFFGGGLFAAVMSGIFSVPDWLEVVLLLPALIGAVVVSQPPMRWQCPRCEKPFFARRIGYNSFSRRCLHCGLPKWAPNP
jgi:hypothetical protein